MSHYTDQYKVDVPEGQSGDFKIKRFTVSQEDSEFATLRALIKGGRGALPPGDYTGLYEHGRLWMSDTPDEIRDHLQAIRKAKGYVLINGLGLGVVLAAVAAKPEVKHVTVVECSPDVIALVGPHYQERFGDRIEIVQDNAFTYKPPKGIRYGMVWHDIWPDICSDNLPAMKLLHRRYGRRADWQGSWCRSECERGY